MPLTSEEIQFFDTVLDDVKNGRIIDVQDGFYASASAVKKAAEDDNVDFLKILLLLAGREYKKAMLLIMDMAFDTQPQANADPFSGQSVPPGWSPRPSRVQHGGGGRRPRENDPRPRTQQRTDPRRQQQGDGPQAGSPHQPEPETGGGNGYQQTYGGQPAQGQPPQGTGYYDQPQTDGQVPPPGQHAQQGQAGEPPQGQQEPDTQQGAGNQPVQERPVPKGF